MPFILALTQIPRELNTLLVVRGWSWEVLVHLWQLSAPLLSHWSVMSAETDRSRSGTRAHTPELTALMAILSNRRFVLFYVQIEWSPKTRNYDRYKASRLCIMEWLAICFPAGGAQPLDPLLYICGVLWFTGDVSL